MGVAKDLLQTDLDYSAWATRRLLQAASALTGVEISRDLGLSHRSILLTLDHIYDSEQFWANCLQTDEMPPMSAIGSGAPRTPRFEQLQQAWPRVWSGLNRWFASVPEEKLDQGISCRLASGNNFLFPRWQLLRHCVNHSTLHRGQIVSMLRMLGQQPPNIDMTSYFLRSSSPLRQA